MNNDCICALLSLMVTIISNTFKMEKKNKKANKRKVLILQGFIMVSINGNEWCILMNITFT